MCMSLPCSVAAVRMADGLTFVIYEFWETEEEWKRLVEPCPYPMPGGGAMVRWSWQALCSRSLTLRTFRGEGGWDGDEPGEPGFWLQRRLHLGKLPFLASLCLSPGGSRVTTP